MYRVARVFVTGRVVTYGMEPGDRAPEIRLVSRRLGYASNWTPESRADLDRRRA